MNSKSRERCRSKVTARATGREPTTKNMGNGKKRRDIFSIGARKGMTGTTFRSILRGDSRANLLNGVAIFRAHGQKNEFGLLALEFLLRISTIGQLIRDTPLRNFNYTRTVSLSVRFLFFQDLCMGLLNWANDCEPMHTCSVHDLPAPIERI